MGKAALAQGEWRGIGAVRWSLQLHVRLSFGRLEIQCFIETNVWEGAPHAACSVHTLVIFLIPNSTWHGTPDCGNVL